MGLEFKCYYFVIFLSGTTELTGKVNYRDPLGRTVKTNELGVHPMPTQSLSFLCFF